MLLCLFASIPLGSLHKRLPSPALKHLYSAGLGFFMAWFTVGNGSLHVLAASLLVYALAAALPRRVMPFLLTAALVAYLSAAHIYRLYSAYLSWEMDVSLIMMIFVVKASTFAFAWADGQQLRAGQPLHAKQHLHEHRRQRALSSFPSLLQYLSYIWCFAGVLVGPCFEIGEYLRFTDGRLLAELGLPAFPSSIVPALQAAATALACYPFVYVHGLYPIAGYVDTAAYRALPLLPRLGYAWLTITCCRFKYYFAWYLASAGCISCGLGLSSVQRDSAGRVLGFSFSRCENAHALAVETATSMPAITNNWNIGVNGWLKHCVYYRVEPPAAVTRIVPAKSLANLVTKLTAACWHGFYPAYYLFFVGAYLVNEMDDVMRARLLPLLPARLYAPLAWLLLFSTMNSLGMAFQLMQAQASLRFWASFHYAVFWLPPVVIACCLLLPRPARLSSTKGRATAAANTQEAEANGSKKREAAPLPAAAVTRGSEEVKKDL